MKNIINKSLNLYNRIGFYKFTIYVIKKILIMFGLYQTYILIITKAPFVLYYKYIATFFQVHSRSNRKFAVDKIKKFNDVACELTISNVWFMRNIPYWILFFKNEGLYEKNELAVLEIGSWEGLSCSFILHELPNANITCVDTWEGADEHKSGFASSMTTLKTIENKFDENVKPYSERVKKYKGKSYDFFAQCKPTSKYDLVYIDGSHHADDVIIDAIKSYDLLNSGGCLIFDDYLWQYYRRPIENPAGAINFFLKLKSNSIAVIYYYYDQLIIKKL